MSTVLYGKRCNLCEKIWELKQLCKDGFCPECHGNTKPEREEVVYVPRDPGVKTGKTGVAGRLINKPPEEEMVPGDLSDQMYDQARDDEAMAEARLEATGMFPTPLGPELDGINNFLERPL